MIALKPMLVAAGRRQHANAVLSLLKTVCSVIGPALGGLTVAGSGRPPASRSMPRAS
jgi:hypothetical protein